MTPQLSSEANRTAAEEWLVRARQLHEAADDAAESEIDERGRILDGVLEKLAVAQAAP